MTRRRGDRTAGAGARIDWARAVADAWYDRRPGAVRRALLAAATPLEGSYVGAARLRGALYDRGWLPARRGAIPVVSVGNLVAGGAGKTPVALAMAERLIRRGHRVALVSRGYGGRRGRGNGVRMVSDGSGTLLTADEVGDEPHLLSRRLPSAMVLVGADRGEAVAEAAARGATIALLDDGFQHRRLARDLDVLVVDASDPVGNGRLLPRGPLREPLAAARRADLVWLTRVDGAGGGEGSALDRLLGHTEAPVVRSVHRPAAVTTVDGVVVAPPASLAGRPVVALAAIARPEAFVETLERLGARVSSTYLHGDHHRFHSGDVEAAAAAARAIGGEVVTTEKDAARLPDAAPSVATVRVLRIDCEVREGAHGLEAALDAFDPAAGGNRPTTAEEARDARDATPGDGGDGSEERSALGEGGEA